MNIWFSESTREQGCADPECARTIQPGDFVLNSSRRRGREIATDCWHPDCLIRFSKQALEQAKSEVTVGRKQLPIDKEARERRIRLLHQYAANKQRMAAYQDRLPDKVLELRIQRLMALQQLLRLEIMKVGGPPNSWLRTVDAIAHIQEADNEERTQQAAG